jgi:hypothetical protein
VSRLWHEMRLKKREDRNSYYESTFDADETHLRQQVLQFKNEHSVKIGRVVGVFSRS